MPATFAPAPLGTVPGLPLVGNLLDVRRDRLELHMRCMRTADLTRLRLAWRTGWVVTSAPLAHQVAAV